MVLWVASTASTMGIPNAAVLPVPVWACPTTSRPSRISGTTVFWIGVGVL